MSGDRGYRAVLADCERALGRPEVALRLVTEALAEDPDSEEAVELRLVEAGARADLGEDAAARLVLESALGGRPDPAALSSADPVRLRVASAYADLLRTQGEEALATEWLTAVAAADPDDLVGAVDRLGIEFTEVPEPDAGDEDDEDDEDTEAPDTEAPHTETRDAETRDAETPDAEIRDVEIPDAADTPPDDEELGRSFDEEVEAEVAELLGETGDDTEDPTNGARDETADRDPGPGTAAGSH